jgi:peptide/nickel transport system substrate-binding protein
MLFPVYLTKPIIRYPLRGVVGPYRVENIKFKQGYISEISLIPHTNNLSPITYKFYENDTKLINAFKAGEIYEMSIAKKSNADQFQGWRNLTVTPVIDYSVVMTLFINNKNQLLSDKGVRQAIGMAIPRDELKLYGDSANGPISPISWAYYTDQKRSTFDLDTARKNIKKATESSPSAALKMVTYYDYSSTANVIQKNLESAGLKIDTSYSDQRDPSDFDLLLSYWQTPADPDQYFYWHSTQMQGANITRYKNVKIDKLLEDGRSTLNIADRKKYYEQFQKVLIDDSPAIFIYHPYTYTVKRI